MFLKSHTLHSLVSNSYTYVYVIATGDRNKNKRHNSSCKIHLFCSTNAVKIWGEKIY